MKLKINFMQIDNDIECLNALAEQASKRDALLLYQCINNYHKIKKSLKEIKLKRSEEYNLEVNALIVRLRISVFRALFNVKDLDLESELGKISRSVYTT